MLRITRTRDKTIVLQLEGKLVDRWVGLVQRLWEDHQRDARGPLILNLSGVSFASQEGIDLLRRLQSGGVICTGWPPFLRALCDLEGASPERNGGAQRRRLSKQRRKNK